MTAAPDATTRAWRVNAALTHAIAAGKHNCHCGAFGPFRLSPSGSWLCMQHVTIGSDGLFHPLPQS